MQKNVYLDNLGWNTDLFTVLTAEEVAPYLELERHQNNIYSISDPKGVQAFGKGAKVVNIKWLEDNAPQTEVVEAEEVKAPASIPPPPTPKPVEEVKEEPKEEVQINPILKSRIASLNKAGFTDNIESKSMTSPEGDEYSYQEIYDLANKDFTDLIKVEQKEPANDELASAEKIEEERKKQAEERKRLAAEAELESYKSNTLDKMRGTLLSVKATEVFEKLVSSAVDEAQVDNAFGMFEKKLAHEKAQRDEADKQEQKSLALDHYKAKMIAMIRQFKLLSDRESEDFEQKINAAESQANIGAIYADAKEIQLKHEGLLKTAQKELKEAAEAAKEIKENAVKEESPSVQDIEKDEEYIPLVYGTGGKVHEEDYKVYAQPSEITSSDAKGFFAALASIGFQQLNLSFNKLEDDKINIIVKPVNFSEDPAYDNIQPMTITGTAEELDEGFFKVLNPPIQKVHGLMTNAKAFLEQAAEQAKKTKQAEENKKKIKDLVDKAKKYDEGKDAKPETSKKKWDAVVELDPDNKDAKKALDKLAEEAAKAEGTLKL